MSNAATPAQPTEVCRVIGTFQGAFKLFAENWHGTLKSFGIEPVLCHVIATDCMAQFGQAMSKDSKLEAAVGKAKKSGMASFKISGNTAGIKVGPAMTLVRIVQQLDEKRDKLRAEGYLLPEREFNPDFITFEPVQEYWKELPVKAKAIVWFETAEGLEKHLAAKK